MINEYRFDDKNQLIEALLPVVVEVLQAGLACADKVSLLVSGGSTPGPLYHQLSQMDLDWARVQVALVDERWVDSDHTASNEKLTRQTLLQNHAARACFTGMKNSASDPCSGVGACEQAYQQLVSPFTLCLLGMGPDGHTASLFLYAEGLSEALVSEQRVAAIKAKPSAVTGDNLLRMTLTAKTIVSSDKLILLFTGTDKWDVYEQAKTAKDIEAMPVSLFLQQANSQSNAANIDVYWAP